MTELQKGLVDKFFHSEEYNRKRKCEEPVEQEARPYKKVGKDLGTDQSLGQPPSEMPEVISIMPVIQSVSRAPYSPFNPPHSIQNEEIDCLRKGSRSKITFTPSSKDGEGCDLPELTQSEVTSSEDTDEPSLMDDMDANFSYYLNSHSPPGPSANNTSCRDENASYMSPDGAKDVPLIIDPGDALLPAGSIPCATGTDLKIQIHPTDPVPAVAKPRLILRVRSPPTERKPRLKLRLNGPKQQSTGKPARRKRV
ncbi:hypothetical protein ACLMJK_007689 [Lecanora helva]